MMTSSRFLNSAAILLAFWDWEQVKIPSLIDDDNLMRLAGACLRIEAWNNSLTHSGDFHIL